MNEYGQVEAIGRLEELIEVERRWKCLKNDLTYLTRASVRNVKAVLGEDGEDFVIDMQIRMGGLK